MRRDPPDRFEGGAIGQRAGRVVRRGDDDEPRARRQRARDRVGIEGEVVLEAPLEAHDVGAEQPRRAEQRIVPRALHQHVVAGLEHGGQGLEVRARGAVGRRHLLGPHAVAARDGVESGLIAVVVAARQQQRVARALEVVERAAEMLLPARSNVAAGRFFAHSM